MVGMELAAAAAVAAAEVAAAAAAAAKAKTAAAASTAAVGLAAAGEAGEAAEAAVGAATTVVAVAVAATEVCVYRGSSGKIRGHRSSRSSLSDCGTSGYNISHSSARSRVIDGGSSVSIGGRWGISCAVVAVVEAAVTASPMASVKPVIHSVRVAGAEAQHIGRCHGRAQ
jgi:hypothetical protein